MNEGKVKKSNFSFFCLVILGTILINGGCSRTSSPLNKAILRSDEQFVAEFVNSGKDINRSCQKGEGELCPLCTAVYYSKISMAQQLIDLGANVDCQNGMALIMPVVYSWEPGYAYSSDSTASKKLLSMLSVIKLLLENGANPRVKYADKLLEPYSQRGEANAVASLVELGITTENEYFYDHYWGYLNRMSGISDSERNKEYRDFKITVHRAKQKYKNRQKVKSDWNEYSTQNTIKGYQTFLFLHPDSSYTTLANQKIAELKEMKRIERVKDQADFNIAERENILQSYDRYIQNHPTGMFIEEALYNIFALINEKANKESLYLTYYDKYPGGIRFIPIEYRLLIIGPKKLKISALKRHLADGIGDSILISKVKRVTEGYKNFDLTEVAKLKEWNFNDQLISAMMDVTFALEKEQKEQNEKSGLRAEIERLTALVEKLQASQGGQQSRKPIGVDKQGNPIYDALAEKGKSVAIDCAKKLTARLAKVQACGALPYPLSTACEMNLESDNSCPM